MPLQRQVGSHPLSTTPCVPAWLPILYRPFSILPLPITLGLWLGCITWGLRRVCCPPRPVSQGAENSPVSQAPGCCWSRDQTWRTAVFIDRLSSFVRTQEEAEAQRADAIAKAVLTLTGRIGTHAQLIPGPLSTASTCFSRQGCSTDRGPASQPLGGMDSNLIIH